MASIENNIKVFIFLSVLVLFPNFAYANEKLTNQNLHDFYALFEKSKMKGPDSLIEFFGKHLHPDYKYSIASHHINIPPEIVSRDEVINRIRLGGHRLLGKYRSVIEIKLISHEISFDGKSAKAKSEIKSVSITNEPFAQEVVTKSICDDLIILKSNHIMQFKERNCILSVGNN